MVTTLSAQAEAIPEGDERPGSQSHIAERAGKITHGQRGAAEQLLTGKDPTELLSQIGNLTARINKCQADADFWYEEHRDKKRIDDYCTDQARLALKEKRDLSAELAPIQAVAEQILATELATNDIDALTKLIEKADARLRLLQSQSSGQRTKPNHRFAAEWVSTLKARKSSVEAEIQARHDARTKEFGEYSDKENKEAALQREQLDLEREVRSFIAWRDDIADTIARNIGQMSAYKDGARRYFLRIANSKLPNAQNTNSDSRKSSIDAMRALKKAWPTAAEPFIQFINSEEGLQYGLKIDREAGYF